MKMTKIWCALGRCKHNSKQYISRNYYGACKLRRVKIDIRGCESFNGYTDEEIERKTGSASK